MWKASEMTVTLTISKADVYQAREAIASNRVWKHCECEPDVGYTCGFCKRHFGSERRRLDLHEEVIPSYVEMLFASLQKGVSKDALLSVAKDMLAELKERYRGMVVACEIDNLPLVRKATKAIAAMEQTDA